MPANLTPVYLKSERDYRRAQTVQEQVDCLQRMLQTVPKHKGTDRLQGDIKSRLREARRELQQQADAPRSTRSFRIPRQGAGRIVVVGAPNAGKSLLLKALTSSDPQVAPFPFTTREPLAAMMDYQGLQIQLIDTPPVSGTSLEPWMLNLVRTADGVLLAFDGSSDDAVTRTSEVIAAFQSRKTRLACKSGFDPESFATVNVSTTLAVTRAASADSRERLLLLQESEAVTYPANFVELSTLESVGDLREALFRQLNVIRVYTRPRGGQPDMDAPLAISVGGTPEDLALLIHEDLARNMKHAKLWRRGEHDGKVIGRDYELRDGDIIEVH